MTKRAARTAKATRKRSAVGDLTAKETVTVKGGLPAVQRTAIADGSVVFLKDDASTTTW